MDEPPDFDGETYDRSRDKARLTAQLDRVRETIRDGNWRTLAGIADLIDAPEASISARLRDLRKKKFGGYKIDRRYLSKGLWEYRMDIPKGQMQLPL